MSGQHIVCYSGGHSSALVALDVARRFGTRNLVLLNHDMHFSVEHADIKRFKRDVAEHIGVPLTFASRRNAEQDQFDVCVESSAFKVGNGSELCTARLKTEPFMEWLAANASKDASTIYYGFDATEPGRIQRRIGIMGTLGWKTDYPRLWDDKAFNDTDALGIVRPCTYTVFKHGNCIGCLKAGWQHWYIVYCTRPDIWLKGKWAEDEIGHAIHWDGDKPVYLDDMEPRFAAMRAAGIQATEHIPQKRLSYLQASADACGVEIRRLGHEAHCLAVEIGIADLRGPDHYRPTTASAGFGRDFNLERRAPEPKK